MKWKQNKSIIFNSDIVLLGWSLPRLASDKLVTNSTYLNFYYLVCYSSIIVI